MHALTPSLKGPFGAEGNLDPVLTAAPTTRETTWVEHIPHPAHLPESPLSKTPLGAAIAAGTGTGFRPFKPPGTLDSMKTGGAAMRDAVGNSSDRPKPLGRVSLNKAHIAHTER